MHGKKVNSLGEELHLGRYHIAVLPKVYRYGLLQLAFGNA